jgi:hypothetical protein
VQDALFAYDTVPIDSWVYVIGAVDSSTAKIGTAIDAPKRLGELQVGNPHRLAIRWKTPGGRALEQWLHGEFDEFRLVGEWFDFGDADPVEQVAAAVQRYEADPRYEPNELGCRIIPPITRKEDGTSGFAFTCSGACGSAWICFD